MIVGYLRNSFLRDGTREGASIERQQEVIQNLIVESNLIGEVAWYTDDGISGARNAKLTALQEIFSRILEGRIKIMMVERLDRLGRNASEVTTLLKRLSDYNVSLYSVKEGHINPLIGAILAGFAEAELDKLSFRVQESRLRSFATGRAMGIPKLGYTINEEDMYQVDPETQPQVQMIFELYGSGKAGVDTICSIMESLFPHSGERGEAWSRRRIIGNRHVLGEKTFRLGGILNDGTYIGQRLTGVKHGFKDENGNQRYEITTPETWSQSYHPPIIERAKWDAVQTRLEELENKAHGGNRHVNQYVFSDVIHCPSCGEPFVGIGGATVKGRPWNRTARQMCRRAWKGRCSNVRTVDMACCQALILSILDEELYEGRSDANEEMILSQTQKKADMLRKMGRLSLSLNDESDDEKRASIQQEREVLRAMIANQAEDGRKQYDTALEAVSLLLAEFPRDVKNSDNEIQEAAKIVRGLVSRCFVSDENKNRFRFRLETLQRAYTGTFRLEFRSLAPAMYVILDYMRASGLSMTTADAKSLVMRSGFERRHGLRSLTSLEREELVEYRQGHWYLTGRSPLMIGGLSAIMSLEVRSESLL